jgi:C-terminal processing protease CtpA/Prc
VPEPFDLAARGEIVRITNFHETVLLEQRYGYVRVTQFHEGASLELDAALRFLSHTEKLAGLILDLRRCSGGLVKETIKIVDLFLESGLIAYIEGRAPGKR